MLVKTLFAGFGGQGVLMMGYCVAYTAMLEGRHVTFMPSYGAEVRGGTANCTVTISTAEIASPVASSPENVVVMNQPSMERFQHHVRTGGALIINSTMCEREPVRKDISVHAVPATRIAEELGDIRAANMVLAGAFTRLTHNVSLEMLLDAVGDIVGRKRAHMLELNHRAIIAGHEYFDLKKPAKKRKD
ncbi:MAG: 2-oxoacid:acceptor oxidoreductase family protein [bacterium]